MGAKQSLDIEDVQRLEAAQSLIVSFFQRTTGEQWLLIELGEPDNGTKTLLAEFLLEIVACVSNAVLSDFEGSCKVMTEEYVLSTVGIPLFQSFAEFLVFEDKVQCDSTDRLMDLIIKEVTTSVNSAPTKKLGLAEPVTFVTAPCRLDAMVGLICKILHTFNSRGTQKSCKNKSQATSFHEKDTQDPVKVEEHLFLRTVQPKPPEEASSAVSFVTSVISEEVINITAPLLKDVPDSDSELLQSASSMEIEKAAVEIVVFSSKNVNVFRKSKKMWKLSLKTNGKIKNILSKQFIIASVYHIVAQLQTKFNFKGQENKTMSLLQNVKHLLNLVSCDYPRDVDDLCVFWRLKHISSGRDLEFTKNLCSVIYACFLRESHAGASDVLYADIWNKVQCCLGLMSWWLNTQAIVQCVKVIQTLMDSETDANQQSPMITVVQENRAIPVWGTQEKLRKLSVRILVGKAFLRAFRKARTTCTTNDYATISHLFEKTWVELEGANFDPKSFKKLEKDIFLDLSRKWGSPAALLSAINSKEPVTEDKIVSSIINHLTQTKRRTLFTTMYEGFVHILRYRNRVGVI